MTISAISSIFNSFPTMPRQFYDNINQKRTGYDEFIDKNGNYNFSLNIPGVKTEDIKVTYDEKNIYIQYRTIDRNSNDIADSRLRLNINNQFNLSGIKVKHENGVLMIIIPKNEKKNNLVEAKIER